MHNIELETKDLIIRKAKKDDYKSLLKNYWSKEKTAKFMLWKPIFTDAEAIERIEKTINFEVDKPCFIITEKSSGESIGMVGFIEEQPQVYGDCGLGIGCDFVGRGYGSQVLSRMLQYLFYDCKAKKVIYTAMKENISSNSLQKKFNFSYVQTVQKTRDYDNLNYEMHIYELTSENYFKTQNQ